MNIIDYKINENKLDKLIETAISQKMSDIQIYVNYDTFQIILAQWKRGIELKYKDDETIIYYMGVPFMINKDLNFGEANICGYKEKECTRVTCYSDGTPVKIEKNIKEKIYTCIE